MNPNSPPNLHPSSSIALGRQAHPQCVVCSPNNPLGLGVRFAPASDGGIEGEFTGRSLLQGYPGWLHGGIIAALLDGAMTHCLFAHGHQGVTGQLSVRYRHPVQTGTKVQLRAWITESHPPLFMLRAQLRQEHCVKASATAKFMERR